MAWNTVRPAHQAMHIILRSCDAAPCDLDRLQVGSNLFAFAVALALATSWTTLRDQNLASVQLVLYLSLIHISEPTRPY